MSRSEWMARVAIKSQRSPHTTTSADPICGEGLTESATMLTIANVEGMRNRCDLPESSIGGQTTCIVCMKMEKTHLAVPCGHQSVCFECSKQLQDCPYCRESVQAWVKVHVV